MRRFAPAVTPRTARIGTALLLAAAVAVALFEATPLSGAGSLALAAKTTVERTTDVVGNGIAFGSNAIYYSTSFKPSNDNGDSFVGRLPRGFGNNAVPMWISQWPNIGSAPYSCNTGGPITRDGLQAVDVGPDGVYLAGFTESLSTDTAGCVEGQATAVKYRLDGVTGGSWGGAEWYAGQRFYPASNGYGGSETFFAGHVSVEGSDTFFYAGGGAQSNGCNSVYAIRKYDALGRTVWQWQPNAGCGGATFYDISVSGDSVFAAGDSSFAGNAPQILRFNTITGANGPNATFTGSVDAGYTGARYTALTVLNGYLYAAGFEYTSGERQAYLLDGWDTIGNRFFHRVWSSDPARTNNQQLLGIAAVGGRLFAVGYTRTTDNPAADHNMGGNNVPSFPNNAAYHGFADAVIFEIDPADGTLIGTTNYGLADAADQALTGVTTDGTDLYVTGAERYPGQNLYHAVFLRYQLAGPAATMTTATASPNPSTFGQSVTFSATVLQTGGVPVASGSVTFKEGDLVLGGPVALNASGRATLTTSALGVGSHTMTAEYSGAAGLAATSGSVTQTINFGSSRTTVTSGLNPSQVGRSVTLTAAVTAVAPAAGIPSGTVQFKNGATLLGVPVATSSGIATLATSTLAVGSHAITAEYSGDSGFSSSTGTLTQTVNKANSVTVLTSSANPSTFRQTVTFTATITSGGIAAAEGSVTLKDGALILTPTPVALGSDGKASFSISTLVAASHTITAEYSGSTNFNSSNGTITQTVNKANTTTSLSASPSPSIFAQTATFAATVLDASAAVSDGTVTFKSGATVLSGPLPVGSDGRASFSIGTLAAGPYLITAEYSGASNFNAGSGSVNHTVNPLIPDISVTAGAFVFDGSPHEATASVTGLGGQPVNGDVSFSYTPGGFAAPVDAGSYSVTAHFFSRDPNYSSVSASLGTTAGAGTWVDRAPRPAALYGAATASINGKLYVASGCCTVASGIARDTRLDIYDPATNGWTQGAPIPTGVYGAGAVNVSDMLWVIGGQPAGGNIATVQVYDPATNAWSTRAPLPQANGGLAAVQANGTIYAIGGMNPSNTLPVDTVYAYDALTNSWSSKTPMPTSRVFAGAAVQNGKIHVIGGYDSSGRPLTTLEMYDIASDTWQAGAAMPTARYGLTVEALNGTIYAIGGNAGASGAHVALDTVELYEPNTNTWSAASQTPATHYSSGSGVVGGVLYLVGGSLAPTSFTSRTDAFTPAGLHITPAAASVSVTGGTFTYDGSSRQATGSATGVFGAPIPGSFAFTYSPGGSSWPRGAGTYGVTGVFSSADPNYYGGFAASSIVIDRSAATVNSPGDQFAEAIGPAPGSRQVFFNVSAFDADGLLVPTCSPASGSVFLIGTTSVTCTAKGANSLQGSASFSIIVRDTIAPNVSTPNDQTREATGPAGAVFTYNASAFDNVDGTVSVSCDPPSGRTFSLGATTITCSAIDAHGNTRSRSFALTVRDTIAPQIQQVSQVNAQATSADGTIVHFPLPTAADAVDPYPIVTTSRESGSLFPHGSTQVTVTAKDFSNNTRTSTFTVHVEASLVSIDVRTAGGEPEATVNVNDTQPFIAIGHFTDGSTQSTADTGGGGDNGGGSGANGDGGGTGAGANVGFWNAHFTPGLSVSACGTAPVTFSSQSIAVDPAGQITNTQWSPITPTVAVTGQVTANQQTTLTLTCLSDPAISTTATIPWQGVYFSGPLTFSGVVTTVKITGWSSQPPKPTPGFSSGAAEIGGKVYTVGGVVDNAPSGLVEAYDVSTRAWQSGLAPMSPREGPGVAALNGLLYVAGGHAPGGAATSAFQSYDPNTNTWTNLAPMPTARAALQLVDAGGMLYAIGGQPGSGPQPPLTTVERYNPATNTWDARASTATPRMFFAAGALNSGATIIAVGAHPDGIGAGPSTELYDVVSNTWTPGTPLALPSVHSAGVAIDNRFYVASGQCGGQTLVYRPAGAGGLLDGWALMPHMLNPRSEFATAAAGDVLYAIGGLTGTGQATTVVATVDALSTPPATDLAYAQGPFNQNCGGGDGGDGGDSGGGDDDGPTWRIVDPATGTDSSIASIDAHGLAAGVSPGTAIVVAEFAGVSCFDTMSCATLTVNRYTPAFGNLSSQSIVYGTSSIALLGVVSAASADNPDFPAPAGTVDVTINGIATSAEIGPRGEFSATIDAHVFAAGSYPVTYGFAGSATFHAALDGSTMLTVAPAPLVITATDRAKTYGDTATFDGSEFTASGLVNNDTVASVTLTSAGAAAGASAGSYAITPGGAIGSGLDNYAIEYQTGTLTVSRAALTITAEDVTRLLGEPLPAFTATFAGFVADDTSASLGGTLTFTTSATAASPVGTYPVTPGGVTSPSYVVSFVPGTLTVKYNICPRYDTAKVHPSGSTIQITLLLCDASGSNVSSPSLVVHATSLVLAPTNVSVTPGGPGNSNPDNDFKVMTSAGGTSYAYTLSTRDLATGTYNLSFMVSGDDSVYSVPFQVR